MEKLILPIQFRNEKGKGKNRKIGLAVPTWNHTYYYFRGVPNLTASARKYKEEIEEMTRSWCFRNHFKKIEDKKVIVNIWLYYPDKRKRDAHNMLKILMDALEGHVFEDDKWALVRIQDWQVDRENPRFELSFEEVEEDE